MSTRFNNWGKSFGCTVKSAGIADWVAAIFLNSTSDTAVFTVCGAGTTGAFQFGSLSGSVLCTAVNTPSNCCW